MILDNNIEKYLLFVVVVAIVIFMAYFVYNTIKNMTKQAPKMAMLYKLNDDDPKVFNQILIDIRDSKIDYVFENFDIQSSTIDKTEEYGMCLILKMSTGNDLWEVSFYEDIVEIFNLTNSKDQTTEIVYDKEDIHLSKEDVYQKIIDVLENK